MKAWLPVPALILAAACGGGSTDYNDAAANDTGVNAIADAFLMEADLRARNDVLANGTMPAIVTAAYDCADGSSFNIRFDNQAGAASLAFAQRPAIRLEEQRTASGIWYRNEEISLRGKGREATLSRNGEPDLACTARE